MSAMPISWHEECLSNMVHSYLEAQREADRAAEKAHKILQDMVRYEKQINKAKRLKKPKFDAERFSAD